MHSVPPALYLTGSGQEGSPWTETPPPDRDPLDRDPTLDKDPRLDKGPPWKEHGTTDRDPPPPPPTKKAHGTRQPDRK